MSNHFHLFLAVDHPKNNQAQLKISASFMGLAGQEVRTVRRTFLR